MKTNNNNNINNINSQQRIKVTIIMEPTVNYKFEITQIWKSRSGILGSMV